MKKPLSQVLRQRWFHNTKNQITEKVIGRLLSNWYHENGLLMTHLFGYDYIFMMILWTVQQSHPFPQPANQLCCWQGALLGTMNSSCTRGCWHIITKIFGFRTMLTSQICVPNKSPQCTNSIGTFEWNLVLGFTIWIPTYWEIFFEQSIGVSERHMSSNSYKRYNVANLCNTSDIYKIVCHLNMINPWKKKILINSLHDMQGCNPEPGCCFLKLFRYFEK